MYEFVGFSMVTIFPAARAAEASMNVIFASSLPMSTFSRSVARRAWFRIGRP